MLPQNFFIQYCKNVEYKKKFTKKTIGFETDWDLNWMRNKNTSMSEFGEKAVFNLQK